MVSGANFIAKEDRRAAHALLDDPAALRHAGDQLQHVVPLAVGACILQIAFQKPAISLDSGCGCIARWYCAGLPSNQSQHNISMYDELYIYSMLSFILITTV